MTCRAVDFLRVEPGSERYAGAIEALFGDQVGKAADAHPARQARRRAVRPGQPGDLRLSRSCRAIAAARLTHPDYGLALTTRRNSWGPNYLRFGLQLQNDFEGNSSFNAAARGTLAEITKYGGEWVWDLQVGETPRVATEVYLPVGYRSRWFVAPHAEFQIRTLPLADEDERILAEYRVRTTDYGIDLGRELGNYGEVRVGGGRSFGAARVRVGDPLLPLARIRYAQLLRRVPLRQRRRRELSARTAAPSQLGWQGEREGEGRSPMPMPTCWSTTSCTRTPGAAIPASSGPAPALRLDNDVDVVRSFFSLGGFLNMSGITPETLVGPAFRHRCAASTTARSASAGTGFLDVPVYIGASLEQGNVWNRASDISFGSARTNGSLFLGTGYLVGPVYFATGLRRRRRLGVLPVPRPDFLRAAADVGKRRRSDGVREAKRGSRVTGRATRAASRPCRTSAPGLSPGREYSCLRAISMSAASRSAARAVPVRLVPVRAEQLSERIARLQRDAHAIGTLDARVGTTQIVRMHDRHEISGTRLRKRA